MGKAKMIVDLAMTALFLGQMGYHMMDNRTHEWTGICLLVLFALHHILNWRWHRALTRGRYTPRRVLLTAVNVLLTIAMLTVAVSAVLVSRSVFDFLGLRMRGIGRRIHMPATMWFFVFMGLHMGLHVQPMLTALHRRWPVLKSQVAVWLARIAALVLFGFGMSEFYARGLCMELFMLREFAFLDYGEPLGRFILSYAAITAAWALLAHTLGQLSKLLLRSKREGN